MDAIDGSDRTPPSAAQRRLAAEYATARVLAGSERLTEATPKILEAICTTLGWEHGGLWRVDRAANVLRCVEIWHVPDVRFAEFEVLSRRTAFASGVGLPGRVWASGRPAWIPDVLHDNNFPRAPTAAKEGLHAAFGFPIVLHDDILGVMEFFSREIREPDDELLAMLGTIGSQIGQFMERRRAEEELDRFFALSLDMLCIAGFDGYFKRLNAAWERTLGFTCHELLARPYLDFVHPDDRESTLAEVEKVRGGAQVLQFENRYRCRDGSYRWFSWTAVPVLDEQLGYAVARDITERRAASEQLVQYARKLEAARAAQDANAARLAQLVQELGAANEKAVAAAEAKAAFLANMSHEIRTPMTAIVGMADLALETRLTAEQREYIAAIKQSADALHVIINDILDFSKIEAGKLDLEQVPFALRDSLEDSMKALAVQAQQKGLELACHIRSDVPDAFIGDPGRLQQVVTNLVGNAIKFTERGEVLLTVEPASLDRHAAELRFAVSDTGIGIPADKHAHVFDAFAQADDSMTRRFGGTGLGLAIASQLVALMGGTIWLESEVGRGSTFSFTARVARPRDAAETRSTRRVDLHGLPVLVVDDSATNRRILEEMLVNWRMKPIVVSTAQDALKALAEARAAGAAFPLALVDGQMPGIDGFSLVGRIKQDRRLASTAVVMLTSAVRPGDVARCRRIGVAAHLTKPVKQSDLLDTILSLVAEAAPRTRPPAVPRARKPASRRMRILLAEDNAVNRRLVVRILEKRGHSVVTAPNGRLALDVLDRARGRGFDAVLMDVQMPDMDGFAATAAIRAREVTRGARLPIIAMTAHALKGDRERCLAAGMDDYLSKPIQIPKLVQMIERLRPLRRAKPRSNREWGWGPTSRKKRLGGARAQRPVHRAVAPARLADEVTFDEKAALARAGGDRDLLRELVQIFLADAPKLMSRARKAVKTADAEAVRRAAHALKGAVGTLCAPCVQRAAEQLEALGRDGEVGAADAACTTLASEMARLTQALNRLVRARGHMRRPRPRS
jgi:PAS domain S-box-containing protein